MVIVMSPKDRFFCPSIHGHDSMAKINWGWSDHHVTSVPQEPILQILPKSAIVTVSKTARTNARVGSRGTSEIHIGTVSKLSANYWRWPKNHPNDLNFWELHPLKTLTLEFLPPPPKKRGVGLYFFLWNLALFQVRFALSLGGCRNQWWFLPAPTKGIGFSTTFSDHFFAPKNCPHISPIFWWWYENEHVSSWIMLHLFVYINIHMYYIAWTNFKKK